MKGMLFAAVCALMADSLGAALIVKPAPPPTIQSIATRFNGYDLNADGIHEINSFTLPDFEPAAALGTGTAGTALVLVDPRLLNSSSPGMNAAIRSHLINHRDDLVREGYRTRVLIADLYRGAVHQDGRTLMAVRRFLRELRLAYPSLKGVTLVGSFPDATLFRRVLAKTVENGQQYLTLHPERINPRADIVLADLDGGWEELYQPIANNEHLKMSVPNGLGFPYNNQFLSGTVTEISNVHWEDIFYIQEDYVERMVAVNGPGSPVTVYIASNAQRHPELTAADRTQPNPIARPEIIVSRIDAKGIALNPTGPIDRLGRSPLDSTGTPQSLEFDLPPAAIEWSHDILLEQRIVADYFDRNHQHRIGVQHAWQYRTGAIQQRDSGLMSATAFNQYLRLADSSGFQPSRSWEQADIVDYVNFLKEPAVLRGISAHSNAYISQFASPLSVATLETALGGDVWAWQSTFSGGFWRLTPSAQPLGGNADWTLGRTLWENRSLMYVGQTFYVHGGCGVNVPDDNWHNVSHDDFLHGFKNNADSVMFFENGLALLARGKTFYDLPSGFGEYVLLNGGRFGFSWRGSFETDGANAALKPGTNGDARVWSNKKAYFWGLRGDWTVRLR